MKRIALTSFLVTLLSAVECFAQGTSMTGAAVKSLYPGPDMSQAPVQIIDLGSYWDDYGCGSPPPEKLRSSAAYRILQRNWEAAPFPNNLLPGIGQFQLWPPENDGITSAMQFSDVIRQFGRDYSSATQKPRLLFEERTDIAKRVHAPMFSTDPRFLYGSYGCQAGTASNETGTECNFGKVPLCVGGTRDGYWCPLDQGNTYCPGGGTCTATAADLNWVATIPAADHATAVSTFTTLSAGASEVIGWDTDFLCDGTVLTGPGNDDCGVDYPFVSKAQALAELPTDSVGYALLVTQDTWPLTSKPVYYISDGMVTINGTQEPGENDDTYDGQIYAVSMDLRIADYRKWAAARMLDQAYQGMRYAGISDATRRAWPIALGQIFPKAGWWTYYDSTQYPGDSPPCAAYASTHMWTGPAQAIPGLDDAETIACGANLGGLAMHTPYGAGEFEEATRQLALLLLAQTSGAGDYFSDVVLTEQDAPEYRNIPGAIVPAEIRRDPKWIGVRYRPFDWTFPPFGAPTSEALCATPPYVEAGGPYVLASGGEVRLDGTCVNTSAAAWSITAGATNCTFKVPWDGTTTDATDPMALLKGCTADGTIRLTCGASTDDATVDVQP